MHAALLLLLFGASCREPHRTYSTFSVEHTAGGSRVTLRECFPPEFGRWVRTSRLTIVRDGMGRAVEVVLSRDDGSTISDKAKRERCFSPGDMDRAIEQFSLDAAIDNETVEFDDEAGAIHRASFAQLFDHRRDVSDRAVLQNRTICRWTEGQPQLIVDIEDTRRVIQPQAADAR